MFKQVDSTCDQVKLEHRILAWWDETDAFNKLREKNKGKKKWSFIDGPITANNPMGVHHAWGRTLKDTFQRYQAMLGRELRYQNGFDCQGLWVEVEVEKELGFKSKKEVEAFGIEKFVNMCKARVKKYAGVQTEQSIRLGYWMDWDNSYYTMSEENNYTIWSFLKKLFENNKVYRGTDVVPWSGRSGTSYSQMEIIEGRKLVAHRSIFVRFKLKAHENEYLLVWTTTPWTLTSNVAAAVNVGLDYVKCQAKDGAIYYFAKENLEFARLDKQFKEKKQWVEDVPKLKTLAQIFKERGGYEIIDTIKGADMVGWEYEGPYDHLEAQNIAGGYPLTNDKLEAEGVTGVTCHRVIDGGKDSIGSDIVVAGEGTGIVHIAPGCGDIDHKIGQKEGLVEIAPLTPESTFLDKFDWLTGKSAIDHDVITEVIDDLKTREIILHVELYPHVYPHCWRSGEELVYRLVDEWYINMDWRDNIKNVVEQIEWKPAWGKDRENEWLTNMGDWMISKKRFWGLALPIWEFEDDTYWVIGSKEELKELCAEGWEEFEGNTPHRPWIDKVKIRHPESGLIGTRIKDVGNPWLDAGIVPFSTLGYNNDKAYWNDWFPGDLVLECFPGQFRNWFYSLLAMSTTMENRAPFKTLLGHALVRDENGKEMHKSTGNSIPFNEAADKLGSDTMRWMYCNQNPTNNLNFGYGLGEIVQRRNFSTWWNVYSFFINYARLDGFDVNAPIIAFDSLQDIDRWLLSKLQELVKAANTSLSAYDTLTLMQLADDFIDRLSNWYVRRNRRRFWRAKSESDQDKLAAYQTLYKVLVDFCKVMAPIVPFLTEDMYQNLVRTVNTDAPESVHHCDYPQFDENLYNENIAEEMDLVADIVNKVLSIREINQLRVRQPLSQLSVSTTKASVGTVLNQYESHILDELNIKKLVVENVTQYQNVTIKPNHRALGPKVGKNMKIVTQLIAKAESNELAAAVAAGTAVLTEGDFSITLTPDDISITQDAVDDMQFANEADFSLALFTTITPELKIEGLARDLVRNIQQIRKESGFEIQDRISVTWYSDDQDVQQAIKTHGDYICKETLSDKISQCETSSLDVKLAGATAKLSVAKL